MKYVGSKARIAKEIAPIIMRGHDPALPYIEPFLGGGNMMQAIDAPIRWGSDTAVFAVALLEALANGWRPPEFVTTEQYYEIKRSPNEFDPALVGFAAYCASFGARMWGGPARRKPGQTVHGVEQSRACVLKGAKLRGVRFRTASYDEIDYPNGSTVYCDPPYRGSLGYKGEAFDSDRFWGFARRLSKKRRVFVSEYQAPPGWVEVWSKQVQTGVNNVGTVKANARTEKLFVYKGY